MENVVNEEQMLDALREIRGHYEVAGKDPYDIDFDSKPADLPDKISTAWDTYKAFWDRVREKRIIP